MPGVEWHSRHGFLGVVPFQGPLDGHDGDGAAATILVFLLFAEEIGAPVDQVEQGKHQRERYPGDNVDALRAGTLSGGRAYRVCSKGRKRIIC